MNQNINNQKLDIPKNLTSRSNSKVKHKSSEINLFKNKKIKKKECNLSMNNKINNYIDECKFLHLKKNDNKENNLKYKKISNKKQLNKINSVSISNKLNNKLLKSSRKKTKNLIKNNSVGNVSSFLSTKQNQSVIINNYNSFNYIFTNNNNNKIEVKQSKKND